MLGVGGEGISVNGLSRGVEGGENVCKSIDWGQHRARFDRWSTEGFVVMIEMPQSGVNEGVVGSETKGSLGGRLDQRPRSRWLMLGDLTS